MKRPLNYLKKISLNVQMQGWLMFWSSFVYLFPSPITSPHTSTFTKGMLPCRPDAKNIQPGTLMLQTMPHTSQFRLDEDFVTLWAVGTVALYVESYPGWTNKVILGRFRRKSSMNPIMYRGCWDVVAWLRGHPYDCKAQDNEVYLPRNGGPPTRFSLLGLMSHPHMY